jgi:hypothetical protein
VPHPESSRSTGEANGKHCAGQVQMDREPGRIGFMSTQRRENRSAPATKIFRRGPRNSWQRTSCAERTRVSGGIPAGSVVQFARASANVVTASPEFPDRMATNSLQTEKPIEQLVGQGNRRGSPPSGRDVCAAAGPSATLRSSLFLILIPSVFARLHPTLPQAPAAVRHWAERYDGKRDMHLKHAA